MARSGRLRHAWRLAALVALFSVIAVPASVAARQSRYVDISATKLGRALIGQTSTRLSTAGHRTPSLRAYRDAAGYLVAPSDAILSVDENGVLQPMTAAAPNVASPQMHANVSASGYNLVATQCFARIYHGLGAALDHCYQLLKLTGESSPTQDYYALLRYATVFAGGFGAYWGEISSEAFTTQAWMDWAPKGDRSGNCVTAQISIEMNGYGLFYPVEKCETWDMTKWNPQVKYKLRWTGPVSNADRELAYEIGVKVSQGAWPQWFVPAAVHTNP